MIRVVTVAIEPCLIACIHADSAGLVPCEWVIAKLCLINLCRAILAALILICIL